MRSIEIDFDGRTVWAGGGLTSGEYTKAVGSHGLATGFGDSPLVGIGGTTLGGGAGYLHRKLDLTIDSLIAAEVVTADGDVLITDATSHPDLFWAIRGGGNFGVATRFRFRLHDVDHVHAGMLLLPASAQTVAGFLRHALEAPEELSGMINVTFAPPMPSIPAEGAVSRVTVDPAPRGHGQLPESTAAGRSTSTSSRVVSSPPRTKKNQAPAATSTIRTSATAQAAFPLPLPPGWI
jgi:FAD/FMN-containing dehydrogenase